MDISSKSKAHTMSFIVFSFLFMPAITLVESNQQGFISAVISDKGIDFAKDLLIQKAISTMIPLQLPDFEKSSKIPLIGKVKLGLSNTVIYSFDVASSSVETGESGIVLVVSGATANISMDWKYSYKEWIISISDKGSAAVQVQGMVVRVNATITNQEGTLKLTLLECGCQVEDISIKVDGGASWLYQGIIDAFQGKIVSEVENAINKNIREGITKLDSLLQSIPKQMKVNSVVALNVTFVDDPVLRKSSVELEVDGLFTGADGISVSNYYYRKEPQAFLPNRRSAKMVEISLHENVFESAATVYFNANYMHWSVDQIPDQSIMNTAGWKYIIPQLYEQYPDDDMNLSIVVTSVPIIRIIDDDINTTIYGDLLIEVLNSGEVVPVACISLVISTSCSAEINGNNLAGSISLVNFISSLKWSNIGNLQMHLVQAEVSTILKTFFMPYLNSHLSRGFPLPLPHGFTLENAEIIRNDSWITVCSDLSYTNKYDLILNRLPILATA